MTAMARNGTDLGIRVSGLGDRWFMGPVGQPDGLYFSGFSAEDASGDIGDSTITETAGIGAFAMAAAPAIVTFISGTPQDALNATLEMYEITTAEHSHFTIPALDFRGTPTGVDIQGGRAGHYAAHQHRHRPQGSGLGLLAPASSARRCPSSRRRWSPSPSSMAFSQRQSMKFIDLTTLGVGTHPADLRAAAGEVLQAAGSQRLTGSLSPTAITSAPISTARSTSIHRAKTLPRLLDFLSWRGRHRDLRIAAATTTSTRRNDRRAVEVRGRHLIITPVTTTAGTSPTATRCAWSCTGPDALCPLVRKAVKWIGVDCGSADHPMNTKIRDWMPAQAEQKTAISARSWAGRSPRFSR